MPKHEPSPEDPLELVGCPVPGGAGTMEAMARCHVEEFFLMGWSGEKILSLFQNPFYRGPHSVYRAYGEDWVEDLIAQVGRGLVKR